MGMSAVDLESQDSVDAESSEYDDDDEDDDDDDYYTNVDDDEGMASDKEEDPESFEFEIIDSKETQKIFDSLVAKVSQEIKVRSASLAILKSKLLNLITFYFPLLLSLTNTLIISVLVP